MSRKNLGGYEFKTGAGRSDYEGASPTEPLQLRMGPLQTRKEYKSQTKDLKHGHDNMILQLSDLLRSGAPSSKEGIT